MKLIRWNIVPTSFKQTDRFTLQKGSKMKRRILLLFVCLLISLTIVPICGVSASNVQLTVEEMAEYLIENGIPAEILDNKHDSYIEMMYEKLYNIEFIYGGTATAELNENSPSDADVMGVIPEDELTFNVTKVSNTYYDASVGIDRVNEVYVFIDCEWISGHPAVRKEDAVTVNWDPSVFTYKANSFTSIDYKLLVSTMNWVETGVSSRPAHSSQGSIGYYTDLAYSENVMGQVVNAVQCRGEASLTLIPADPLYLTSGYSVTSINCEYVHDCNLLPVSLVFLLKVILVLVWVFLFAVLIRLLVRLTAATNSVE